MNLTDSLRQTRYVLVNKLALPLAGFMLLILIGQRSQTLMGEYAIVMTWYFVLQTVPLLGLTPFVMRETARRPESTGILLSTVGGLALLACGVGYVATLGVLSLTPYSDETQACIKVVAIMAAPGILAFLAEIVLIALHRARAVAYVAVIENILRVGASSVVIAHGGGIVELTIVLFGTRCFAFLSYLGVLLFGQNLRIAHWPSLNLLRKIGVVLPVFLSHTLLSLVLSRLDFLMLSFYSEHVPLEALGYYAVAYRLFEIGLLAAMSLWMVIFPDQAKRYSSSADSFFIQTRFVFRSILFVCIPATLTLMAVSELYVRLLFPGQYPGAVPIAELFALLLLPAILDTFLSSSLNACDRQGKDLRALAVGGLVYAVGLIVLIPAMGLRGAWLAGALAIAAQLTFRLEAFRSLKIRLLSGSDLIMAVLLASGFGAAAWTLGPFSIPLIAVAYPISLLMVGVWQPGRFLRFIWRLRAFEARDPGTLAGAADHIVADLRRCSNWIRRTGGWNPYGYRGFVGALLYRISRCLQLRGRPLAARLFWQLNLVLTKIDIAPETSVGPGLLLTRPIGVVISARVGRNATFGAWSGAGSVGRRDVGAGPGIPILGDNVTFEDESAILGGVQVPSGSRLQRGFKVYAPSKKLIIPEDWKRRIEAGDRA